ncbi:iron-containing redox enzyme family protein [Nonomuraea zeae]|uniref:Iron-containing redox enzyme family protein n=1 Tax=Nonomuraea zeae TaxID=1642303 RepID=A0A5S4G7L0_9ACTN|nr:iron-containing redox enzyme family protein [Nonomuraea zeae]TMR29008.1 iron-containing redox enzyme family protein [Nonomuraea zeae]
MTTHSEELCRKIEMVMPIYAAATRRMITAPDFRAVYPEYLCTSHMLVRASVPVMRRALERCAELAPHDEVAAGLGDYLREHIPEELGHDEWVREDLAAIGGDPDEPWRRMPPPSVARVVGSQYYWINHYHPVTLLGHITVMEGYPPTLPIIEGMIELTGYPRTGFRNLLKHARLDVHHRKDLLAAIDALPLQPHHRAAMSTCALNSVVLFADVIDDLMARVTDDAAA